MNIGIVRSGIALALVAVLLGAFGAHALQEKVDASAIEIWNKGIEYQFIHAFALMLSGLLAIQFKEKLIRRSAVLFFTGIVLFSGSLYILAIRSLIPYNVSWIGPITPIGGVSFIIGWITMILAINKQNVK